MNRGQEENLIKVWEILKKENSKVINEENEVRKMAIKVETLNMCLVSIPNSWYLEEIGADTLVFRTPENVRVVKEQTELVELYHILRG